MHYWMRQGSAIMGDNTEFYCAVLPFGPGLRYVAFCMN